MPRLAARPSRFEVAVFTRQLSVLLRAGINVARAFGILAQQYSQSPLHEPIKQIELAIHNGKPVSQAFAPHREIFGNIYVSMIAVGERRGSLDQSFAELATFAERDAVVRERLKSALTYPAFVLVVNMALTFCIFRFVLPALMPLFASVKGGLPLCTQLLILIVDALQSWVFIVAAVLGGAFLWASGRAWFRSARGQLQFYAFMLRVPVLGRLLQRVLVARVARIMGVLLGAGIILTEALTVAARSCDNPIYEIDLMRARKALNERASFYDCLVDHPQLYPPLFLQLLSTGESTGKLDEMLLRIASAYELQMQDSIDALIRLIEPLLMSMLALVVGFIIIAIFLPLYGFLNSLG